MGTVLGLHHFLVGPQSSNTHIVTPLPLTLFPFPPTFADLYNSHPNYIDATPSIIVRYNIIDIYPLGRLSYVTPPPSLRYLPAE